MDFNCRRCENLWPHRFDDVALPSVMRAVSFVRSNRAYVEVDLSRLDGAVRGNLAVFRKTADDGRKWDFHSEF